MKAQADAAMTAERLETKYLVPTAQARALADAIERELPRHRYVGDEANILPGAHHFVSTIYFDTPARDLYRAAQESDAHLKLRAKEYYDLHPSLAELATDPRQLVRHRPVLWLEIKFRDGSRSGKRRIGLPKPDVPAFFTEGRITREMVEIQRLSGDASSSEVLGEVADLCGRFAEPLRADCLVNYRRVAWQDPAGHLRVTLDLGLSFFAPPDDLWTRDHALVRETLGKPVGHEGRAVLEIKSRDELPSWLARVLTAARVERLAYSKFDQASRAAHA